MSGPDQRRKHGIIFVDQQSRCLDLPRGTPDRLTETCVGNTDQHHSRTANRHVDGTGRRQSSPDPITRADIQSRDSNSSVDITTNRYANMHDSRADDRNQHNLSTTHSVNVPRRRQRSMELPVTSNLFCNAIPVKSTGQHTYDQASRVGNLDQYACNIGSSVRIHPREKCGCCSNFPSRHCRNESRHVDTHNIQKHKGGDNVSFQYQCHHPVNSVSDLARRHDLTDTEYQNDQSYASRSTYDANRHRTHNTDTSYNHTGRPRSPSPYFSMPARRSRIQSRPYCSLNRQHSQRYSSADDSPVRRDLNQSNKSRPDSRGRLRSRNCSMSRQNPLLDPYDSEYDELFNEKRVSRNRSGRGKIHRPSSYQASPRIIPDHYNGNVDWEEYQSHFEDCAELSNWDHRSKVLFMAAGLKGQARTYYMSLDASDKRSYTALIYKMRQRFGSSQHAVKWLNQLELRQRRPGESITALGDHLRQLAKKAYRNLDTQAQESLALNQLYKLIPIGMKCRCIDHDCQSVQEAVEVIERYEAIIGEATQERRRNNFRAVDQKQEPQTVDPSMSNILKKLDARLEKLESLSLAQQIGGRDYQNRRPDANRDRKCFFCSSPDHMVKNCPEKSRQQGPKYGNNNWNKGLFNGNRFPQNNTYQNGQETAQRNQYLPRQLPSIDTQPSVVQ